MLKAIDENRNSVIIDQADPAKTYHCPICNEPLVQKRGRIKRHHFAHKSGNGNGNHSSCDTWKHDMSEWHINWQYKFPAENCEVVVEHDGIKHIADVLINERVIEFQHSTISFYEYNERNDFYVKCGYKVIWIFDVEEAWAEGKFLSDWRNMANKYSWTRARNPLKSIDCKNKENLAVFFQISDSELNKLMFSRNGNFTFKEKTYTPDKLIYTIKNYPNSFFAPKSENNTCENIPGCQTIIQIYEEHHEDKPYIFSMAVENSVSKENYIIHIRDGTLERESDSGMVIGIESTYNKDTRKYDYSEKKYPIWDYNKPIWKFKRAFSGYNW